MAEKQSLYPASDKQKNSNKMPLLFVGHGSPMNAIEDNNYSRTWKRLGESLPVPKAILSVSAHWLTYGTTKVTAMPWPKTIHDFGGFPKELYDVQYPAPGSPDFAEQTIKLLYNSHIESDLSWGLDHGTWSVLVNMFPGADIPVYQLSIDYQKPPEYHFMLVKELQVLRSKGILVIGSGNIVHNLSMLRMSGEPFDWSLEFDALITRYIDAKDYQAVVDFQKSGNLAKMAHPSYDHFLPLLYTLGMADKEDTVSYFNEGFDLGSISMRSLLFTNNRET
jgi:4,5-DOPA dioxygenase extradiol